MKKAKTLLLILVLLGVSGVASFAETPANREARIEAWKSMTPEQRQAKKAEFRAKHQNKAKHHHKNSGEKQACRGKVHKQHQNLHSEQQQKRYKRMHHHPGRQ
ncbi:MAG TPA: hypothetical protein V6C99_02105 [Oculatellaceae cyanobacterium]|jgi:hypothetical protein